jgi:protein-disulfide isomerase
VLGATFYWKTATAGVRNASADVPQAVIAALDTLQISHRIGGREAPVRVTEISDYQCPACATAHRMLWPNLQSKIEQGAVAYSVYQIALPQHRNAVSATVAARCLEARSPQQIWTFRHRLLASQAAWEELDTPEAFFLQLALDAKADTSGLRGCLRDQAIDVGRHVRAATEALRTAGVNSVPTFEVNGRPVHASGLAAEIERVLASTH